MLLASCQHDLAKRHVRVLLLGLLAAIVVSFWSPSAAAQTCDVNVCPVSAPLANHLFYIQDLGGGRCIDAGPPSSWAQGSPVFINACNHTNGQEIQVTEIDSISHDVGLSVHPIPTNAPPSAHLAVTAPETPGARTGTTYAGFCIGVHGGTVAANAALELQTCNPLSPAQRFGVDGDAILMGSQTSGKVTRDFVIERQNGSTVPQTPLVVATRNPAETATLRTDARYFRLNAVDGSGAAPTSGFLTVTNQTELACAAKCGWGTVAQIEPSGPLVLTQLLDATSTIQVADGTTIRGYRSQTFNGPQIQTCSVSNATNWPVFKTTGQAVRFTGFRLHGPDGDSGCGVRDNNATQNAIEVDRLPDGSSPLPSVWIDHMEISHWHGAAAGAGLTFPNPPGFTNTLPNPCNECGYPDTPIALMVGNFMHEDVYEAVPSGGQFAQIRANVFYGAINQPVTTREMSCLGGYAAMDNLFLTETGAQSSDDVDMHGSLNKGHWHHGLVGDYFDIGWNTFLKTDATFLWWVVGKFAANVNQRGYSCGFTEIHNNVFLQSQGNAITQSYNAPVLYGPNSFSAQDPTQGPLLVGDFDGDKIDDVFMATGAAWYYSSGAQAEWRYLNRASDPASALLLGDFDGDGRTDVVAVHGPNIDVSWAGVSAWQTINETAWPLANLAVGDFDGDGRSDLLLATGTQWFLASGGQNWKPWAAPQTDTIPSLRFGHFTDTTKTQILRVHKNQWEVTEWGMTSWTPIGKAPVDSVGGLLAGDFNGDGYTDLAQSVPLGTSSQGTSSQVYEWQYTSPRLSSKWSPLLGMSPNPVQTLPIGNFQGGKQDGVIMWSDNHFYFTRASQNEPQLLSRQLMR